MMGFTADYADVEPTRAECDAIAGPLLLEFGAPWCPHCLRVQPILADLLGRFPDVQHIKIYDGKGKPLGRSFRVRLWPTLVFLCNGKVLHKAVRPSEGEIAEGLSAIMGE
jgi:thioredoxin 1